MIRHCVTLIVSLLVGTIVASAAETVTLASDWQAEAAHGGFYEAQALGIYAKYGLEVKIRQGGPQSNPSQLIAAELVDFAIASNASFIANLVDAKAPVVAVMASFQKDPQALICHSEAMIPDLAGIKGHPVMVAKDTLIAFWPWLRKKYGFSDSQIRPYNFNVAPFILDKSACQQGYLGNEPYQIEKASGIKPKVYLLADYGYSGYGSIIVTTDKLIRKKPDIVRAFVAASIEGWRQYFYGDPSPGNKLILAANPEMTADVLEHDLAALKAHFIVDQDPTGRNVGRMNDARWQSFMQEMVEAGVYPASLKITDGYRLDFLPPE